MLQFKINIYLRQYQTKILILMQSTEQFYSNVHTHTHVYVEFGAVWGKFIVVHLIKNIF